MNGGTNMFFLCTGQYEFSLEHRVLTGLQGGFAKQRCAEPTPSSGLLPSCPPYWMMFSTSRGPVLVGRSCSDTWEADPGQRSDAPTTCTEPVASECQHEAVPAPDQAKTESDVKCSPGGVHIGASRQRGQRKVQKAFVPDLLNPPTCLSSLPHQRRKNLRQCSLSELEGTKQHDLKKQSPASPSSQGGVGSAAVSLRASPYCRSQTIDCHGTAPEVSHAHFKSSQRCTNIEMTQRGSGKMLIEVTVLLIIILQGKAILQVSESSLRICWLCDPSSA